jgi:hypothetical protein
MRIELIACPICGGCETSLVRAVRDPWSWEDFRVHRCTSCTGMFLADPPAPERMAAYYSNLFGDLMHGEPNPLFRRLRGIALARDVAVLLRRLPRRARILELGPGDGALCIYLADRGYRVEARDLIDPGSWRFPGIPYRKANLNGGFLRADDLVCGEEMPDAIVMRHVLEHLHEPSKVLSLFHSAGILYVLVVVPNVDSPFARWFGGYWTMWDPPRHLLYFNATSLDRLARRCGYRVAKQRTYGIDEIVTSAFRWALIRTGAVRMDRVAAGSIPLWLKILHPKGHLAGLSSAAMSPIGNTMLRCLMERV